MEIKRAGSQASTRGSSDYFTGTVRVHPLFQAPAPARVSGAAVTFEPGARTAWHRHPLGQTLVVTGGFGRVQRWGGPIEDIQPGDVVWFPPAENIATVLHYGDESVSVALEEVTAAEWGDKVYRPDIVEKAATLYKKPGYDM